jgi:hypothetical protein
VKAATALPPAYATAASHKAKAGNGEWEEF